MSAAYKVVTSRFMGWMAVLVIGSYFLFAVTPPEGQSVLSLIKSGSFSELAQSIYMPRVKLGIDLQGGTYFVLGVQVEKSIAGRLSTELNALTKAAKKENLSFPLVGALENETALVFTSKTEEDAKLCNAYLVKQLPSLVVTAEGLTSRVTLSPQEEQSIRTGVVTQAVHVLTNRLNGYGVAGLTVQRHGARQIVVQLPGVEDPDRVKSLITKTALLELKVVEKMAATEEDLLDIYDGDLPSDKLIISGDKKTSGAYLVSAYADMTGDHIVDARAHHIDLKGQAVSFKLDSRGRSMFKDITKHNVGKNLAIVIDNVVYSAPHISEEIDASEASITGTFTLEEAADLALVLKSGALQAPLTFEQESRIGASLGQDSIQKGLMACLVGLLLIFIFSVFYYRALGVFAVIALIYNLFVMMLLMSYFEWTLTLPGIAGMVLTIGMAVDASILIYEKMREELALGLKSFRQVMHAGFDGTMTVILDSNITTFITGFILFKFGGPAVKGFAVTLMTGILATVVTGVFFLRALIDFALDVRNDKPLCLK